MGNSKNLDDQSPPPEFICIPPDYWNFPSFFVYFINYNEVFFSVLKLSQMQRTTCV